MALPPSGTISVSAVAAEFGGSAPHALSEYYRGGAYVPDIPPNSGVPTSGQISLSDFYGAAAIYPNVSTVMTVGKEEFKSNIIAKGYQRGDAVFNYGTLTNEYFGVSGTYYAKKIIRLKQTSDGNIYVGIQTSTTGTNSGWTNINIGGSTLNRTSFTFAAASVLGGVNNQWTVSAQSTNILYNKALSATVTVVFS